MHLRDPITPPVFLTGKHTRIVSIFSLFRIVKEQTLRSTPLPVRSEVISDCMVELSGIEPLTSCVQGRRSPS